MTSSHIDYSHKAHFPELTFPIMATAHNSHFLNIPLKDLRGAAGE